MTTPCKPVMMTCLGLAAAISALGAEEPMKTTQLKPDFHVAVTGKDSNPGTQEAPFANLAKARDAIRARIAAGLTKDILVQIGGGTYPVTETLTFGPEDSGTETFSITYAAAPGEKVVLSGGRRITGWKKGTNEIWTAEIREVKDGKWYPRQLFICNNDMGRKRLTAMDAQAQTVMATKPAGVVAFGGINVFSEGGFTTERGLFGLENVQLTPHMGAASEEAATVCRRRAAQAVVDVLEGRWPEHPVNPEVTPWFAQQTCFGATHAEGDAL